MEQLWTADGTNKNSSSSEKAKALSMQQIFTKYEGICLRHRIIAEGNTKKSEGAKLYSLLAARIIRLCGILVVLFTDWISGE
jgi:hypothetical protein